MIAYLDSSVLIRVITNQKNKLKEFIDIEKPIASKLLKTECLRALDRLKITGGLNEDDYLIAVEDLYEASDSIEFIDVSDLILNRAGLNFPVAIGTLDAIHLTSAMYWKEKSGLDLLFLTHDILLGKAAIAFGFKVLGC